MHWQEFFLDEFDPNLNLSYSGVIGENTCTGDSGAVLVVEVDGVHQVVGVVSGGTGIVAEGFRGIMHWFVYIFITSCCSCLLASSQQLVKVAILVCR